MERQSDGLEARRMERDKWRKRREEMNAIEDKEKEVENLQKDLAWATVRDKEKVCSGGTECVSIARQKLTRNRHRTFKICEKSSLG